MTNDLRHADLDGRTEFTTGAGAGLAVNLLVSVVAWFWATNGQEVPSDGAGDWFGVAVIAAFAVILAAILLVGHRSRMMWGVVTGTAITIPVDLVGLMMSLPYA